MSFRSFQGTEFFEFGTIKAIPGIRHGISTRIGGHSQGHLSGLNLSYSVEDTIEAVTANRLILATFLEVDPKKLYFPHQTHSDQIVEVTTQTTSNDLHGVDALITQTPGIAIGVMSADCVPVLIADPVKRAIAAIHAGWKGTVLGIVKKTVLKMKDELGCNPHDMIAGIGPSIGAANYEVGLDVIQAICSSFPIADKLLLPGKTNDKAYFDLWKANQHWLTTAGVPNDQIEIAGICTYENPDKFYSARYFHHKTGRFAACISICNKSDIGT
jgi:YfiH family protein